MELLKNTGAALLSFPMLGGMIAILEITSALQIDRLPAAWAVPLAAVGGIATVICTYGAKQGW